MKKRTLNYLIALLSYCSLLGISQSSFANEQTSYNTARDAFRKKNSAQLDIQASLFDKTSPLYAYLNYWQLNLKIDQLSYQDINAYRTLYPNSYLGEKLLIDWINSQADHQQWQNVLTYQINPDPLNNSDEYQCNVLKAHYFSKKEIEQSLFKAKKQWFSEGANSESCDELFSELFKSQGLITEDVWQRVRMNYENISLPTLQTLVQSYFDDRSIQKEITHYYNNAERMITQIIDTPEWRKLLKTDYKFKELAILSFIRMTRLNLDKSVTYWIELEQYFDERDRAFVWGQIATQATKSLHPDAFQWFLYAPIPSLSEVQLEWRIRASLRQKEWKQVLKTIEFLSLETQKEPSWRYWKSKALLEIDSKKYKEKAESILKQLAQEHHYYGQLAREDLYTLGYKDFYNNYEKIVNTIEKPTQATITFMQNYAGIKRAIALNNVGYPGDAMREWTWTSRYFTDSQLLAISAIAMQQQWYERAINTANRTKSEHDFSLRYPILYREYTKNYADYYKIDEAWVYGIIRQESRFNPKTKSSVGAMGLMQLMPQTAQQVANEIGSITYSQKELFLPNQNILFGVFYLNKIWKELDNSQVLATAGYNAGPHRATKWRTNIDDDFIDGAIYVETIPFNETRNYVKQVLMNSVYYTYRLNLDNSGTLLKKRLGTIKTQ